jgi:hypothetical protein
VGKIACELSRLQNPAKKSCGYLSGKVKRLAEYGSFWVRVTLLKRNVLIVARNWSDFLPLDVTFYACKNSPRAF